MSAVQRNNNTAGHKLKQPLPYLSTPARKAAFRFMMATLALLLAGLSAHAQAVTATLSAGSGTQPYAVAVNPVTNKIYMVNNE